MDKQFGGCQSNTAVVLVQPVLNQIMLFEISQHGAAAFYHNPVSESDAQIATMRGNHIARKQITTDLAEHFLNAWVNHLSLLVEQIDNSLYTKFASPNSSSFFCFGTPPSSPIAPTRAISSASATE